MSGKFIEGLKKLDHLIQCESTGTPGELAQKMRISVRCVYNYISLMKKKGAPISYNRKKRSFFYYECGAFHFGFVRETEDYNTTNPSEKPC